MWRASATLSALALAGQVLQLALQFVLARGFGTGPEIDAFVAASAGPVLLLTLLTLTIGQLLVPQLVRQWQDGPGPYAAARNAVFLPVLALACGSAPAFALLPELALSIFTPGIESEARAFALSYLPWIAAAIAPNLCVGFLTQTHNARGRFPLPPLVGVAQSALLLVGFLALKDEHGVYALVVLQFLLSAGAAVVLLASELRAARGGIDLRHPLLGKLYAMSLPLVLVAASTRVNVTVDRYFASFLPEGALALLHYADRWVNVVQAILAMPLVTVLYTKLSSEAADAGAAGEVNREAFSAVFFIGIPAAVWTWIAAPDLARVLLQDRARSIAEIETLAGALRAYGILIAGMGFGSVLVRAFYAQERILPTVLWAGIVPMIFNAILDWLLVARYGVVGLASVTSLNALLGLPVGAWLFARHNPGIFGAKFWRGLALAALASAPLWGLLLAANALLPGMQYATVAWRLATLAALSPVLYLSCARVLGMPQAREILATFRGTGA